jgi:hypothetical protein
VRAHRLAGQITKKHGWKNGTGSAVGCTLHSSNYWVYEEELGIPNQFAFLQGTLFHALPDDQAMLFAEQFLEAIPVGTDLYPAFWRFMLFVLLDEIHGLMASHEDKNVIHLVADFYQRALADQDISWDEYLAARNSLNDPLNDEPRKMLDALDPLDTSAVWYALFILESVAEMQDTVADTYFDEWGQELTFDRESVLSARAAIWRDKLLECLSSTETDNQKLVG